MPHWPDDIYKLGDQMQQRGLGTPKPGSHVQAPNVCDWGTRSSRVEQVLHTGRLHGSVQYISGRRRTVLQVAPRPRGPLSGHPSWTCLVTLVRAADESVLHMVPPPHCVVLVVKDACSADAAYQPLASQRSLLTTERYRGRRQVQALCLSCQ